MKDLKMLALAHVPKPISTNELSAPGVSKRPLSVLVVEDVAETRDGIEQLLKADGYRVELARDESDAIESARLHRPNLILVSLAGLPHEVIVSARRIREQAKLGEAVPVVVFCTNDVAEGDEVALGRNVYVTRPDNFNQLRSLLVRLLDHISPLLSVETIDLLQRRFYDRD